MDVQELLHNLNKAGIKVASNGQDFAIDAPITLLTVDVLQQLTVHKAEILDHLHHQPRAIPMTENQQNIWTVVKMNPLDTAIYNVAVAVELSGELHLKKLRQAVDLLIKRHESLRTLPNEDGVTQSVYPHMPIELPLIDLMAYSSDEQAARVNALKRAEVTDLFDLANGPLFRVKVVQTAPEAYLLLLTAHHLIADGWSMTIIGRNLSELYTAVCQNSDPDLPDVIQLSDYVQDKTAARQTPAFRTAEQYWLQEFADQIPVLDLPTDRQRPARKTYGAVQVDLPLDPAFVDQIKQAARTQRTTFYTFMLAAFETLLHRLSGQDSVVVGIPVAGQMQQSTKDLVGFCVNFLPIRLDFAENAPFETILKAAHQKVLRGMAHQQYPLASLTKMLPIKRDPSRLPLISVGFNQLPQAPDIQFNQLSTRILLLPHETDIYDLFMNVVELPQGHVIQCTGNSDLFDQATIARLIDTYITLVNAAVAQPTTQIDALPMLSELDLQQVLVSWNETGMAYDHDATLPQLFEAQVQRTPEETAVSFQNQTITYTELNRRANQLAHYLLSLGVQPDQFVGLCLERSVEMLVALLAIHKAGAAYLPMDPDYPNERLAFMLEDTQAPILLTQTSLVERLPAYDGQLILIDEIGTTLGAFADENLQHALPSDRLAYVIHTSGSTGKPKGVLISQRNMVNFLLTMGIQPGINPHDRLLAVTTLSFDIAVLELFLPLLNGATVVLADRETAANAQRLAALLDMANITMMQATPATWHMLLAAGWQPQAHLKMLSGGEALPRRLADQLAAGGGELWNMYGPTETTVWSSVWQVSDDGPILIGNPIGNTQMYVLNDQLQPVPVGATGELWIGGDGVAQGYLNRPEMTNARFVPNPFLSGQHIYRTGDLARYRPDGTLECLGRVDFQVKVRGFRIELGEIEAVLAAHEAVRDAVVHAVEFGEDDKRLVAYYLLEAGGEEVETAVLRHYLQQSLPAYMVPAQFIKLDRFPLTPNGKVDRKALPNPSHQMAQPQRYTPPTTVTEMRLAALWQELLYVEQVGIQDDFFELGGHSLLATQMIGRLRELFAVELPLDSFFEAPTLGNIAKQIEAAQWTMQKGVDPALSALEEELEELEL